MLSEAIYNTNKVYLEKKIFSLFIAKSCGNRCGNHCLSKIQIGNLVRSLSSLPGDGSNARGGADKKLPHSYPPAEPGCMCISDVQFDKLFRIQCDEIALQIRLGADEAL